ncbi:NADPH-dependent oxidoreductase [Ramlibacter sp. H39-3-26]|uniref:NADPH-dependent oxidoreductase n=1 Tax=Curvibacter soli TaxID=3031331 RepID=UPI0023DB600E|nr:NADPH-dependent oxidoreductase [Ramlibacter sp. H39-3-26]MDF1486198.1 NADPH-dependent oxidoreductase [Ramlibacter sp. H39-3-26]
MPHPALASYLLRARYGAQAPAITLAASQVLDQLLGHRSVRHFLPDALPAGTIETLVAAAQSAPSSSNLQTWSVIAVQSQPSRDRLAELTGNQAHIARAPLFLAWLADLSRIARVAGRAQRSADGLHYLDTFLMAVIDAALAAQNAVSAAASLGLGTVYAGALRNRPEEVAELLGTPDGVFPVFGLAVGWPDPVRPAAVKPRLPQQAVLHHERYQTPAAEAQDIAAYDAAMRGFQAGQQMPQQDWSAQALDRLRDAPALKGRARLVEALHAAGFSLR